MTVLTAANQLTLLRLLLVPVFAIFMLYGLPGWALVTFAVATVTDALDGIIARHTQPTTLGAWLDPMADKFLLTTMFVTLSIPGVAIVQRIPLWLTVLVLSRDVAIVLTVAIVNLAVAKRTFRPSLLGKATTATYMVTGVVLLYANYIGEPLVVGTWLIFASLALTLLSALEYTLRIYRRTGQE